MAVLYPAPVNYLYFVSKNNGSHQFSSNLINHNKAVLKYQIKRKDSNLFLDKAEKRLYSPTKWSKVDNCGEESCQCLYSGGDTITPSMKKEELSFPPGCVRSLPKSTTSGW